MITSNVIPKLPSGYDIGQSLRFDAPSSSYLSRTPSVAGNRKTWTFSTWLKIGNIPNNTTLIEAGTGSVSRTNIGFTSDAKLAIYTVGSGVASQVGSSVLFRDTSSWYHIIFAVDTTKVNDSDRVNIYINGELQQNVTIYGSSAPSLNADLFFSNTNMHRISSLSYAASNFFDGYLAETHFIDGQALTPDYFGEFDATYGHWKPKKYEGTYGTNGFYLPYSNGGNIGEDISGNGNDFTATNLSATDIVLDSPTNNFATLNVLATQYAQTSTQEGNLKSLLTATTEAHTYSALKIPKSGKWYIEFFHTYTGIGLVVGLIKQEYASSLPASGTGFYGYYNQNGNKYDGAIASAYGASWYSTGSYIIGMYYNADTGALGFTLNGADQGTAFTVDMSEDYYFIISNVSGSGAINVIANFGQDSSFAGNKTPQGNTDANGIGDFYYPVPSGYLALCTSNLEAIPRPYDVYVSPSTENDYFEGTYVGNGSTDGTFIYLGFLATDIVINGTHYDQTSTLFDFNANGIKCRSTTQNANGVTYTIEAWVDVDFKFGNAQGN